MKNKFELVQGLFASKRDNAPDFVIANLSFKSEEFIEWLSQNTNEKGYCNVDLLISKQGSLYAKKNNWKPNRIDDIEIPTEEISLDEIPF